jgi:hypothetical protein
MSYVHACCVSGVKLGNLMNVAIARGGGGDLAERHAQGQRDYQAADASAARLRIRSREIEACSYGRRVDER